MAAAAAIPVPAVAPAPKKAPKPLPLHWNLVAGALAGGVEIIIMFPLDVVKTRFQLQVGPGNAGSGQSNSIFGTLKNIVKEEGIGKLYRGIAPPILTEAPKRAVKFGSNEQYTAIARKLGFEASQLSAVVVGTFAGMTEALIVSPPDVIKNRMQDKRNAGLYRDSWDCLVKTIRSEGPLALTNGLGSAFWKHGVWNAGYFGSIHYVRALLPARPDDSRQVTMMKSFACGAAGGTIGTMCNTPFDVIKTRVQTLPRTDRTYKPTIPALIRVARDEGVSALYKGFAPKVMRMAPGGGIVLLVFDFVAGFLRQTVLKDTEYA